MGGAFLEREQRTLCWPEIGLGEERYRAAELEAVVNVVVEGAVAVLPSIDRNQATGGPDQRPEERLPHHPGGVGEEVEPGLYREEDREGDRVLRAQGLADHDLGAGDG